MESTSTPSTRIQKSRESINPESEQSMLDLVVKNMTTSNEIITQSSTTVRLASHELNELAIHHPSEVCCGQPGTNNFISKNPYGK